MKSLADIMAENSLESRINAIPVPTAPKSVLEAKRERLTGSTAPMNNPTQQENEALLALQSTASGGNTNSLADLAQSAGLRSLGNLSDLGKAVSNAAFGTEFNDDPNEGWSNQQVADKATGVSTEYRSQVADEYGSVMNALRDRQYGTAFVNALKVAPEAAAESLPTLAELAVGGLATKGVKFAAKQGLKQGAKRAAARQSDEVLPAVLGSTATQTAEGTVVGNTVKKMANSALTNAGNSSILTADIVQQQRTEFEEQHGRKPTAKELVGMTLLTSVTASLEPAVIGKFFLPKTGKAGLSSKTVTGAFKDELQKIAARADKSFTRAASEKVVQGTSKVFAAGGAEGAQEYLQTWAEVLGLNADMTSIKNFLESSYELTKDPEARTEALAAMFIGAATGGGIKAGMVAPGTSAQVTGDAVFSAGQKATEKVREANQNRTYGKLNETDQAKLRAKYQQERETHEVFEQRNKAMSEELEKAKTIHDVENETLKQRLFTVAQGKNVDLTDTQTFDKIKQQAIKGLAKEVDQSARSLKGKYSAELTKEVAKKAWKDTKQKATEVAKKIADDEDYKKIIDDLKSVKTSTAASLVSYATEYGKNKTKENSTKLRNYIKEATPEALNTAADKIRETMPEMATRMDQQAEKIKTNQVKAGVRTDKVHDMDTLKDTSIPYAAAKQSKFSDFVALGNDLREVTSGTIKGAKTISTLEQAIAAYKGSNTYRNQEAGALTSAQLATAELAVTEARDALDASTANKAKEAAKTVASKVDAAIPATEKFAKATAEAISMYSKKGAGAVKDSIKATKEAVSEYFKDKGEVREENGQLLLPDLRTDSKTETDKERDAAREKLQRKLTAFINKKEEAVEKGEEAYHKLVHGMFAKDLVTTVANYLDTAKPDVVKEFYSAVFPELMSKDSEYLDAFSSKINEAMEGIKPVEGESEFSFDPDTFSNNQNKFSEIVEKLLDRLNLCGE